MAMLQDHVEELVCIKSSLAPLSKNDIHRLCKMLVAADSVDEVSEPPMAPYGTLRTTLARVFSFPARRASDASSISSESVFRQSVSSQKAPAGAGSSSAGVSSSHRGGSELDSADTDATAASSTKSLVGVLLLDLFKQISGVADTLHSGAHAKELVEILKTVFGMYISR